MYKLGENVALIKHRNQTYEQNQCRGEPYVRPLTETEIKPMSDGDGNPLTHVFSISVCFWF
jgi:hypothetical protein